MAIPINVFHETLKNKIEKASSALNVPETIPAATLLALSAGCIGRTRCIYLKPGWPENANLYLMLVGRPGVGKSPCIKSILSPLYEREKMLACQPEYVELSDPEADPVRRQLIASDTTVQALGKIVAGNPRGVTLINDEIASLLGQAASSSAWSSRHRGLLMSGADSSPWVISRMVKGRDYYIPAVTISLLGGIQPDLLGKAFSKNDIQSGLFPRFLFALIEPTGIREWNDEGFVAAPELEHLVEALLGFELDHEGNPHGIHLSQEALGHFQEWYNRKAREATESEDPDVSEVLFAKMVGQAARL